MRRLVALLVLLVAAMGPKAPAGAESYQRISGEGSSWSGTFIDAMVVNVKQFGMTVDYAATGSTSGRKNWLNGTVDFAASDIPFQFNPEDGSAPENPAPGSYAYIPVTAGGTAFMYNLKINGQRVTNLRLSGENVAKIFAGRLTQWNDPAIQGDNPGLTMPARKIVPVVRSDGSGSSYQFTRWMSRMHPRIWTTPPTSFFPRKDGMIAQSGDLGVAGYVAQNFAEGAIGYVNYSYALGKGFPVAKVLNTAGYYTEPTPQNVAVSLLKARINDDRNSSEYLTQQLDGVYSDTDARNYQLSSYSYLILPTQVRGQFNEAKGKTLGAFAYYSMCQGQQQSASLGYSPMPINLVEASFEQIRKIPGVVVQNIEVSKCKNPTFSSDGTNTLARNAPMPQACDKKGASQCSNGTGGASRTPTQVKPGTPGGSAGDGGGGGSPGRGNGGRNGTGGSSGSPGDGGGGGSPGRGNGGSNDGGSPSAAGSTSGDAGTATAGTTVDGTTVGADGLPVDGSTTGTSICDPDTGVCTGDATGAGGDIATDGTTPSGEQLQAAAATSTVLQGSGGWSGSQLLVLFIVLLTLALVFVPAVAWQRMARERLSGGRR